MPVTLPIVDHPARSWSKPNAKTPDDVLQKVCPRNEGEAFDSDSESIPERSRARPHVTERRIIQSSFSPDYLRKTHTTPSQNGFLWAVYHAYSDHHHLHIRPEDNWFAILTQLSYYINANSERLRSLFVEHEGQKKLMIEVGISTTVASTNFGDLSKLFSEMIASNVKVAEMHDWIMPSFTTTTEHDRVVASILFMGAMKKYFSYEATLRCGLPSVTLHGEATDYEDILKRLDKIEEFGDEPKEFVRLMRPILQHMVMSFEMPGSAQVDMFWNRVATFHRGGSGTDHISGWLGVFSFWTASGRTSMSAPGEPLEPSIVDGIPRVKVRMSDFAAGTASVPLIVKENLYVYHCTMVAGSIGIQASRDSSSGNFYDGRDEHSFGDRGANIYGIWTADLGGGPGRCERRREERGPPSDLTKIRPLTGWVIYEDRAIGNRVIACGTADAPGRRLRGSWRLR